MNFCLFGAPTNVDFAIAFIKPDLRRQLVRLCATYDVADPSDCEQWMSTFGPWLQCLSRGASSKDGAHHSRHKGGTLTGIQAILSLISAPETTGASDWLDTTPPADSSTLHDTYFSPFRSSNTRVLVGEVLLTRERRMRDAVVWAQVSCIERGPAPA